MDEMLQCAENKKLRLRGVRRAAPAARSPFAKRIPNRARRRGQSIIELVAALPFLLFLFVGIVEFGYYLRESQILVNAARDGARAAAIGKGTTSINAQISNAVSPLVLTLPRGAVALEYSVNDGANYYPFGETSESNTSVRRNTAPVGSLVRVTVSYKHQPLVFLYGPLFDRVSSGVMIVRRERTVS